MKAFKGFMKYVGIVILGVIVIGALGIGFMFFTKTSMFGYYFVSASENSHNTMTVDLAGTTTTVDLNIKAGRYGVEVIPSEGSSIRVLTDNNYTGFLKGKKNSEGQIYKDLFPAIARAEDDVITSTNTELSISLAEPEGLLAVSATSVVRIYVPFHVSYTPENSDDAVENIIKYNINITTENGDIDLKNGQMKGADKKDIKLPLNVASLKLTTNRGNVDMQGFGNKAGELIKNLTLENLNISTNGGTFDFTSFDSVTVNNKIQLESKKATYLFNTLNAINGTAGGIEINGTTVKFTADTVNCGMDGFIYKCDTGVLKITNLFTGCDIVKTITEVTNDEGDVTGYTTKVTSATPFENTIFTDSAVVELGSVIGKLGLYDEFGNVTIGTLSHQATMRTENGDIKIGKSGVYLNETDDTKSYSDTSSLILYSTYGDITVGEYYQDAVIYSKKGKIEAHSCYYTSRADRYFYSDISTKDGKVVASTKGNPMKVVASDSANIKFTVHDVLKITKNPFGEGVDMYQAISKNGTVTAILPVTSYKVKVEAKKIEGSIGATATFGDDYVQINTAVDGQPTIKLQGYKAILSSSV